MGFKIISNVLFSFKFSVFALPSLGCRPCNREDKKFKENDKTFEIIRHVSTETSVIFS